MITWSGKQKPMLRSKAFVQVLDTLLMDFHVAVPKILGLGLCMASVGPVSQDDNVMAWRSSRQGRKRGGKPKSALSGCTGRIGEVVRGKIRVDGGTAFDGLDDSMNRYLQGSSWRRQLERARVEGRASRRQPEAGGAIIAGIAGCWRLDGAEPVRRLPVHYLDHY